MCAPYAGSQCLNTPRRPIPTCGDRLHPRYILEMTQRNFQPATRLYDDLIKDHGYQMIDRFAIGPYRNGVPRYTFELYDRQK